jgi:hypothetical protein
VAGVKDDAAKIMYHLQSGWFDEGPQRGPIHSSNERASLEAVAYLLELIFPPGICAKDFLCLWLGQ